MSLWIAAIDLWFGQRAGCADPPLIITAKAIQPSSGNPRRQTLAGRLAPGFKATRSSQFAPPLRKKREGRLAGDDKPFRKKR